MSISPSTSSLTAAARHIAAGEITSADLIDAALERIEKWNGRVGALTEVLTDRAQREARKVDGRRAGGGRLPELAGVPIVVKDLIDTTPAACPAGLPFLADYHPETDAEVVRRLRRAGAVIVGVAATDAGAFGVRTPQVTHPQAPDRSVGGSSGGSAAALAAEFALGALGSDTGGSIRIPSACCLTAGLKPTYGRVSTAGVRPLASSLDHVGPMARRVADLTLMARVLDPAFDRSASKRGGGPLVVGHDPRYGEDAEPEVLAGVGRALEACRALGAEVREVRLPAPDEVLEIHTVVFCAESAAYHFATFPGELEAYPAPVRRLLELSRGHTGYQYVQAMRKRQEIGARVQAVLADVDVVVLPTLPVLAPPRGAATLVVGGVERDFTLALIRYTCLFDHTGNPVLSLPVSVVAPGLGASAQLVGRLDRDADVLAFGEQLEQALDVRVDATLHLD